MITCSKCSMAKPEDDFSWKVKGVRRSGVCRECHRLYRKEHYEKNKQKYKDKARAWEASQGGRIAVRYGLSPSTHAEMLSRFDGKCWLCKERPATHVDHDHSCCPKATSCGNCVRGVLCAGCNTGLGNLGDSIAGLERAIAYLSKYVEGV